MYREYMEKIGRKNYSFNSVYEESAAALFSASLDDEDSPYCKNVKNDIAESDKKMQDVLRKLAEIEFDIASLLNAIKAYLEGQVFSLADTVDDLFWSAKKRLALSSKDFTDLMRDFFPLLQKRLERLRNFERACPKQPMPPLLPEIEAPEGAPELARRMKDFRPPKFEPTPAESMKIFLGALSLLTSGGLSSAGAVSRLTRGGALMYEFVGNKPASASPAALSPLLDQGVPLFARHKDTNQVVGIFRKGQWIEKTDSSLMPSLDRAGVVTRKPFPVYTYPSGRKVIFVEEKNAEDYGADFYLNDGNFDIIDETTGAIKQGRPEAARPRRKD